MPKLLVKHPEQGDLTFTLSGGRITVGRRSDNAIRINHPTVSAHHAEIILRDGLYVIRDLDSTNHSFFEGEIFTEVTLQQPCRLILGTVECDFLPDEVEAMPDEAESLRKAIGFLRRQNDDLVTKIAQQQNQINILGNARLLTPSTGASIENLTEQVKTLTAERDQLRLENKELAETVRELRALLAESDAHPSIARWNPGEPAAGVIVPMRSLEQPQPPAQSAEPGL